MNDILTVLYLLLWAVLLARQPVLLYKMSLRKKKNRGHGAVKRGSLLSQKHCTSEEILHAPEYWFWRNWDVGSRCSSAVWQNWWTWWSYASKSSGRYNLICSKHDKAVFKSSSETSISQRFYLWAKINPPSKLQVKGSLPRHFNYLLYWSSDLICS